MSNVNFSREALFNNGIFFKRYKYNCSLFIETGSATGDGIDGAILAGFDKIISMELANSYYNYCKNKYPNHNNVTLIHGDSRAELKTVLAKNLSCDVFFWLDAHDSGGETVGDDVLGTLPQELETIVKFRDYHYGRIIIAIDDLDTLIFTEAEKTLSSHNIVILGKEEFVNAYDRFIMILELEKNGA